MGDPKKLKKKYSTPQHPWRAERIEEEKALSEEFGLKAKREIWKLSTMLRNMKGQAKKLIVATSEQSKKEEKQLIDKLARLNLVSSGAKIDDILGLDLKKLLERRLQTQVFKKGLAKTVKQARQFITHRHIFIGDHVVNIPSYLVKKSEESKISFNPVSKLSKADHPERITEEKKTKSKIVKPLKRPVEKVEKPKDIIKEPKLEVKEEKKE
jgi:small subunit ribosomal protein S4